MIIKIIIFKEINNDVTFSSSCIKVHGISLRSILPKMVSPPGLASWAFCSSLDIILEQLNNLKLAGTESEYKFFVNKQLLILKPNDNIYTDKFLNK